MRKKIFNIIDNSGGGLWSTVYNYFMFVVILIIMIPLTCKTTNIVFFYIDKIGAGIFIVDYLLRWVTADYALPDKKKWQAFLIYPFTPFAIIDLLSIIPSFGIINQAFKISRVTRLFKILRLLKLFRHSKNIQLLRRVLDKEKYILLTVFFFAVAYIFITALIMFNVEESDMFKNFFDALYWATTALTTVGYGDIYPVSGWGRVISMFSALIGVAVIALPSGVITASYLEELRSNKHSRKSDKKQEHNR